MSFVQTRGGKLHPAKDPQSGGSLLSWSNRNKRRICSSARPDKVVQTHFLSGLCLRLRFVDDYLTPQAANAERGSREGWDGRRTP